MREVCRADTDWPAQRVRAPSVGNSGRLAIRRGKRAQTCITIVRDIMAWHSQEPLLLAYFCNVTSSKIPALSGRRTSRTVRAPEIPPP